MSSQSSPARIRLKSTRETVGEIDTNPSFQSVINTVADTGSKSAECRSPVRSLEKSESLKKAAELQLAREDLAKTKAELAILDTVNGQAQQELAHMKRLVDELTIKLIEVVEMSKKDRVKANEMEHASFTAAEDWKADLEAMQRQHEAEVRDLQGVRLAYEDLKLEFGEAINAKEQAVRMAGEAMKEAEVAAKRAESLSADLAEAKIFLAEITKAYKIIGELPETVLAKSTAARKGAARVAGKESELKKTIEGHQFTRELLAARRFVEYIHEMKCELESLKGQLAAAKEAEYHHNQAAMDMNTKLESAVSEIYQARLSESSTLPLLALVRAELRETQQNLSRASTYIATLSASSLSLTKELEHNQTLILELQERESNAQAEAAALMSKFMQTAEDLKEALVKERKSNETVIKLTILLRDSKLEIQSLRQQVSKASSEAYKKTVEAAEARDQALSIKNALKAAQADTQKALTDLRVAEDELNVARETIAVLRLVDQGTNRAIKNLSVLLEETNLHKQKAINVSVEKDETEEDSREAKAAIARAGTGVEVESENGHAPENEAVHTRGEAELTHKSHYIVSTENPTEREQATHAREEATVVRIGQVMTQVKTAQMGSDAVAAANCGKIKPQNRMQELNTLYKMTRDKEFSVPWEMCESDSDCGSTGTKIECGMLKIKLNEAEEFKASAKTELNSLICMNERLSTNLDVAKLEIETLKFSEQEARKLYERTENEKQILEAEVQRLARKGEQLLMALEKESETLKSNINGSFSPSMSPQQKHQRQPLGQVLSMDLSTLNKEEKEEENAEVLTIPTKKKKKKHFFFGLAPI